MKIGIDATALYGNFGGVEGALWNLLNGLRALETTSSHQWTVYLPADGPSAKCWENFGLNWRLVRLGFRGHEKARRIAWQQTQLVFQAARDGCDVLHSPTYVGPLNGRLPIILTIYDFIALTHPQFATPWNRAHYGVMLSRCARRAQRIIVPSAAVYRELVRRVPEAKSRAQVIPLGVESEFFRLFTAAELDAARARWQLPPRFLLFVGNPEPKKNLPAILAAMALLPPDLREIPLVTTGGARAWKQHQIANTTETTLIADATPQTLAPRAFFAPHTINVGFVPRAELPLLYALCSAFVFPSMVEGFGLPVLEALACGAPVICSNRVPIENVESVALTSHPHHIAQLSQHIAQVLRDENLRAHLSRNGRHFARTFSWHCTAQMTLKVYQSLQK